MLKINKKIKNLNLFVLSFILILTQFFSNVSFAASNVTVSLTNVPYIDVMLAKGRSNMDVTNFANDLKNSLAAKGIPSDKVNI